MLVGFQFDDGLVGYLLFGYRRFDLQFRVNNLVGALVGLDIGLAAGQPFVDERQSLVNKLGGVDGLLVLLVLTTLVILLHEFVENVPSTGFVALTQ